MNLFSIFSKKKINWQKEIGSPLVSSLLLYDNLLISCTFNSWITNTNSKSQERNFIYALDINNEGKYRRNSWLARRKCCSY